MSLALIIRSVFVGHDANEIGEASGQCEMEWPTD